MRKFDPIQDAGEECGSGFGMRAFDPMQGAEEECGSVDKRW
jgi:hypothetical protein